jgi:Yip1-like protein
MSIQTRVIAILTKPADEWRKIAAESPTVEGLMREYAAPLAAIPAIAQFIGLIRFRIVAGFVYAVVSWVFALVGAWIAAVVIERLAPTFQSKGSTEQALKLVVYSTTPIWIAGVLYLVPALAVLIILAALYAVYLFYLGLPPVMSTPSDKVIPYMVVSAVVIIIVSVVVGYITTAIFGFSAYRSF